MPGEDRRVLKVRVKPRSSRTMVVEEASGDVTVSVHAPPDKGAANREAARLLASHFGLPVSAVRLLSGASSRVKRFEIAPSRREPPAGRRRTRP